MTIDEPKRRIHGHRKRQRQPMIGPRERYVQRLEIDEMLCQILEFRSDSSFSFRTPSTSWYLLVGVKKTRYDKRFLGREDNKTKITTNRGNENSLSLFSSSFVSMSKEKMMKEEKGRERKIRPKPSSTGSAMPISFSSLRIQRHFYNLWSQHVRGKKKTRKA